MSTALSNLLLCRSFARKLINERDLSLAPRFVAEGSVHHEIDGPLLGIAPSGRRVSVEGIRIDRIEGGKIAESWMQWDTLGMLQQVGAVRFDVPAPAC